MQTGYFVHKVLGICKLLKLTWSCCLLPSALGRLGIVWEGRFKPVTFPSFQHRVVWSHLTRTSSIFAIVVFVLFPVVDLLTFRLLVDLLTFCLLFFAILDVVVSDIDVVLIFLATFIVLPQLPTSGGLT